jgi:predicted glycosyltransferase involved in capsule biosynthesis
MHDHTNEQHYGIIKILQVSNLENNIKALKSLHKNYLNIEVQSTNNNLNHEFSNGINNTCEKSEIQKKKTFFINAWTKMFFLMW